MASLLENSAPWIEPAFVYSSSFARDRPVPRTGGGGRDGPDTPDGDTQETVPAGLLPASPDGDGGPYSAGRG